MGFELKLLWKSVFRNHTPPASVGVPFQRARNKTYLSSLLSTPPKPQRTLY